MTQKDDGGPAFPRAASHISRSDLPRMETDEGAEGCSLRDYFAAKAMAGILGRISMVKGSEETVAELAYVLADARKERYMSNEREVGFYWVQRGPKMEWEVAVWCVDDIDGIRWWGLCGIEDGLDDSDLFAIDERQIVRPHEESEHPALTKGIDFDTPGGGVAK